MLHDAWWWQRCKRRNRNRRRGFCLMRFLASINHGDWRCPMAAMRPHSQHGSMQQSANMLGNRLISLKLEKSIIIKFLARLVLILAGALFYATVTFSFFEFFCSVQKYSILSTTLTIILAMCTLVRKKEVFPPPKNEGQAKLHPPFFITAHTPPVHGSV